TGMGDGVRSSRARVMRPSWGVLAGLAAPPTFRWPVLARFVLVCNVPRIQGALRLLGRELPEDDVLHCLVGAREDHPRGERLDLFTSDVPPRLDLAVGPVLALPDLGGE